MKPKIQYYANLLLVGTLILALDSIVDRFGPLVTCTDGKAVAMYITQIAVAAISLLSMWGNFTFMKSRPRLARQSLTISAMLIIIQYYMCLDANLLWLLPMIAVVYISRYETLTSAAK